MQIPIEVSGRHIHLSKKDLDSLFGKNYQFTNIKNLSQPGEFACEEKVTLKNGNKNLKVRVVGPVRLKTQIEISKSDAEKLNLSPPRKISGDLQGSGSIEVIGTKGSAILDNGLILAMRHVHCDENSAQQLNLKDEDKIDVQVLNEKKYIFKDVIVRINKKFKPAMHIDVDEAILAGINIGDKAKGEILQ